MAMDIMRHVEDMESEYLNNQIEYLNFSYYFNTIFIFEGDLAMQSEGYADDASTSQNVRYLPFTVI